MLVPHRLSAILIPLCVLLLNLLILLFPRETIAAAQEGLQLWLSSILPSLLPFVVGVNLLAMLGAVRFFGVLLEPVMRGLFNVGGSGGFALAVGLLSGYPMGAKTTATLRANGEITQDEAERLAAFASNAGPLFLIGAVANGMFGSVAAGWFLMLAHYGGAVLTGLLFRGVSMPKAAPQAQRLLSRAFQGMADARRKQSQPFGVMLGKSVADTMETLLQVGGFIVLFSVIVRAMDILGLPELLAYVSAPLASRLGLPDDFAAGLLTGWIEMANGARRISALGLTRAGLVTAAAMISWGGLSVHAQALSFLSKTDVRARRYLSLKLVHVACTVLLGFLAFPLFAASLAEAVPVSAMQGQTFAEHMLHAAAQFGLMLGALVAAALIYAVAKWFWRQRGIRKGYTRRQDEGSEFPQIARQWLCGLGEAKYTSYLFNPPKTNKKASSKLGVIASEPSKAHSSDI